LREKTGKGTADILKAWQLAFEKVGSDEEGKDIVKSRINAVQGHFVAVIAELEAMAQDLQAHHETDLRKNRELEEEVQRLIAENEGLGKELAELEKKLEQAEEISKEWDKERQDLKAENEKLKNTIMAKLEKL
jgi:xylose isomerase